MFALAFYTDRFSESLSSQPVRLSRVMCCRCGKENIETGASKGRARNLFGWKGNGFQKRTAGRIPRDP